MGFTFGLDLGQAQDYTALGGIERTPPDCSVREMLDQYKASRPVRPHYHLRLLRRYDLGTSYPTIVANVLDVLSNPAVGADPHLVVDATGVGRPVVDLLWSRAAIMTPVVITGGNATTYDHSFARVPKRELVSRLQVVLQQKRLKIASALPHAKILRTELENFRVKVDPITAHDSYNGRDGVHDDMVLAVALAIWKAMQADGDVFDIGEATMTGAERAELAMTANQHREAGRRARAKADELAGIPDPGFMIANPKAFEW